MANWRDFVCVGDSQLLRFCKYVKADPSLCWTGCSIAEILEHLRRLKDYRLPSRLIILVGTNDLRRGTAQSEIARDFKALLRYVLRQSSEVIVITTPIIPYRARCPDHLDGLRRLRALACSFLPRVTVVDLGTWDGSGLVRPEFFEKRYYTGKPDNLHLNKRAFTYLISLLEQMFSD